MPESTQMPKKLRDCSSASSCNNSSSSGSEDEEKEDLQEKKEKKVSYDLGENKYKPSERSSKGPSPCAAPVNKTVGEPLYDQSEAPGRTASPSSTFPVSFPFYIKVCYFRFLP